jgi:hypothetical protein
MSLPQGRASFSGGVPECWFVMFQVFLLLFTMAFSAVVFLNIFFTKA